MSVMAELRMEQHILDSLLEAFVRISVVRDPHSGVPMSYFVEAMNVQAERLLGWDIEAAVGRDVCELFSLEPESWPEFHENLEESGAPRRFEFVIPSSDRRFLFSTVHLSADDIVLFFAEVTYRARAEEVLRIHEVLFNQAQDIILYVDMSGRVINGNEKACESYGYTKDQLTLLRIQDIRHPSTADVFEEQMRKADEAGVVFESVHLRSDGSSFPVEVSAKSTDTERGKIRIHIIRDITERKEQEGKIGWLARHDGLTGTLNRTSFIGELEKEILRAQRSGEKFAVLLFDIDKFKTINDTFGHVTGDFVLRHVAASAKSTLRQSDHIGRFGGDEFVVLQIGVKDSDDVMVLVKRLRQVLERRISYGGVEMSLSISLGASLFPDDATNTTDLLHFADQAMYHVKRQGGNGYSLYRGTLIP